jgi:hypothetical protein
MRYFKRLSGLLFMWAATCAAATQPPTLTSISPRTDFTKDSFTVTLTGTGLTADATLLYDPPGMIKNTALADVAADGGSATTTFTLLAAATGVVNVTVKTTDGTSVTPVPFDTGRSTVCLEAFKGGGCELRLSVTATSATGSSSQSKNTTSPNILATLDYQFFKTKSADAQRKKKILTAAAGTTAKFDADSMKSDNIHTICSAAKDKVADACNAPAKQGVWGRASGHLVLETGYTQIVSATKLQSTTSATSTTTGSGTACPGTAASSSSSTTPCMTAATPQQAYIADAKINFGWTMGRDGNGTFSEMGFGARGSFQDLIATNQIVQNGGLTYLDLSSNNSKNVVGIYEATAHYKLSAFGHDRAASDTGNYHNVSNFAVLEAGYQNNSGLQQLMPNSPQISTRNRFIGRFYLYPPLPAGSKQTKITLGMEFNGGIGGGPKIVQIFFGTNINPAKLFGSNSQ